MNKGIEQARNEGTKQNQSGFVRVVFRRVTKFLAIAAIIIVLLLSPFWGSMIYNEIRLIIFDSQMSKIEQVLKKYDKNYRLVAKGKNTHIGGNCNCVSFSSVRVYYVFFGKEEEEEALQKIQDINFRHAVINSPGRHPDDKPEVYAYYNTLTLTVEVTDGAYDAGMDFRFW